MTLVVQMKHRAPHRAHNESLIFDRTTVPLKQHTAETQTKYWFLNTQKTGGRMLATDLLLLLYPCNALTCGSEGSPAPLGQSKRFNLSRDCEVGGCEGNLHARLRQVVSPSPPRIITMLQRPSAHVRSMYAHCLEKAASQNRPLSMGFEEWLDAWVSTNITNRRPNFNRKCWGLGSPWNFQMNQLVQARTTMRAHKVSLRFVQKFFHVGITEQYHASLCLLGSKLGRRHLLDGCTCNQRLGHVRKEVQTPFHPETSLSTVSKIRALTSVDELLYSKAQARFILDLKTYNLTCLLNLSELSRDEHTLAIGS